MTLRTRLVALATIAVAIAIIASSLTIWVLIRWSLMNEVDNQLLDRVDSIDRIAQMVVDEQAGETNIADGARLRVEESDPVGEARVILQNDPIGVQLVASDGNVTFSLAPGDIALPVSEDELNLLDESADVEQLRTISIGDDSYRVMSVAIGNDDAVLRLIYPLANLESTMTRIAWLLAGVSCIGIFAAGGLGWLTARTGLRPVDELVGAAEQVATTRDLAHRIDVSGNEHDEVVRLGSSLNAMLAALESARAQQRELVENAGHELRTPLTTLRNDLGLLVRAERHPDRSLEPEERARLLEDLEAEAEALSDLVAEIVDLARGELEPEPLVETNLRALIERAAARTRRVRSGVEVSVQGPVIEATAHPDSLERAIANLLRNALQVSADGSVVEATLREDGGHAVIEILDRGPGISESDMPRVFDRFYRGEGARERQGSGLGLAIVAQIANLHAGQVSASNRKDGGAAFTLRIPISPDSQPLP